MLFVVFILFVYVLPCKTLLSVCCTRRLVEKRRNVRIERKRRGATRTWDWRNEIGWSRGPRRPRRHKVEKHTRHNVLMEVGKKKAMFYECARVPNTLARENIV